MLAPTMLCMGGALFAGLDEYVYATFDGCQVTSHTNIELTKKAFGSGAAFVVCHWSALLANAPCNSEHNDLRLCLKQGSDNVARKIILVAAFE